MGENSLIFAIKLCDSYCINMILCKSRHWLQPADNEMSLHGLFKPGARQPQAGARLVS